MTITQIGTIVDTSSQVTTAARPATSRANSLLSAIAGAFAHRLHICS